MSGVQEAGVGRPLSRVDGPLKVSGTARFTAEVRLEGLVYAAVVCSTIARGRITRFDSTAAERVPGIIAVMTHENSPRMKAPLAFLRDPNGAAMSALPVMQDNSVRWNGQPVAVIVAETQEIADQGASLVRIDYQAEHPALAFEALLPQAQMPKNILGQASLVQIGDAEAALKDAAIRADAVYRTPRYYHNAIELHASTAQWDGDDSFVVHDSSQVLGVE